jgi:L-cysteine desulfidase
MTNKENSAILRLIKREVIPAIGCTEPIAVALAVAKATETLGTLPESIDVSLSPNVLKNAMGVGIPGTGMVGLPIAIALGAVIGKSTYGLEVLKDITPESLEKGKELINKNCINISLNNQIAEKLYIEVVCKSGNDSSKVIILHDHTNIAYIEKNKEIILNSSSIKKTKLNLELEPVLSYDKVYDFAMDMEINDLHFILKSAELNKIAANESTKGVFGHSVSETVNSKSHQSIMGDSIYTRMMATTAAACDVRMAGAMIPVMSNSGSGNQGIAATLPVVVFAEETGKTENELIRALILSHLLVIYIKQSLGKLSALCGAMIAATGSAAGITFLMGGSRKQIAYSIINMIGNLTGMICDGAKPSCALKVSSSVSTATISALMAMDNRVVSALEGIADEDVDKTIRNLTKIGSEGMSETDKMVLSIMTNK